METISHLLVSFVLNSAWQGTLIVTVTSGCALVLRKAPARCRHMLWVAALVLALIVPIVAIERGAFVTPLSGEIVSDARFKGSPPSILGPAFWVGQLSPREQGQVPLAPPVALLLAACYAAFVLYRFIRFCLAWRIANGIRAGALGEIRVAAMAAVSDQCRTTFGLGQVPILCSPAVHAPLTMGTVHPVIILPLGLLETLSQEMLTTIIGHEMAHIKRRDFLFNLIYELLYLPVSFHPATMVVRRRIARSRELACDEMVTNRLLSASAYARSLVEIAGRVSGPGASGYSLGVLDTGNLEERIMRLTDKKYPASPSAGRSAISIGILPMTLCGLAASRYSLSTGAAAREKGAVESAQASQKGEFPAGTYRMDFTRRFEGRNVKGHIIATFGSDGQVVARLVEEGDSKGKKEHGAYKVDRDKFLITDSKEHPGTGSCFQQTGRYKWRFDGKVLVFTKIEDGCEGRAEALTAGPWSPYSEDK